MNICEKLLSYIHKIYRKDNVTIDIFNAVAKVIDKANNNVKDIYNQLFFKSATWYIEQKEKEFGLEDNNKFTFELRKARVKARMVARFECSVKTISDIVNLFGVENEVTYNDGICTVFFKSLKDRNYLTEVRNAVEERKPAHIQVIYRYKACTHEMLSAYTHEQLSKYTHAELQEGVINEQSDEQLQLN